jgi:hypothetical protein
MKIDPWLVRHPNGAAPVSPACQGTAFALATQPAQRSDEVHSWKDVVSQRPHQCRLVRDNVSRGDREGLGRVVVGERSADRLGVGFHGGPFLPKRRIAPAASAKRKRV